MFVASAILLLSTAAAPAPFLPAQTSQTRRVSISWQDKQTAFPSEAPAISDNGRFVVFASTDQNLVPNDTNGVSDIFLRDTVQGTISRLSMTSAGVQANGASYSPSISANGRRVAFHSDATNLVPGDSNGVKDVFLRDVPTTTTVRVSVTHSGAQTTGGDSIGGVVSGDGHAVAFRSWADNIPSTPDANGVADIFLWTEASLGAERVSLSFNGGDPNRESIGASISFDGRHVAYYSAADNILPPPTDTNNAFDVFVRDTLLASNTMASRSSAAVLGDADSSLTSISADGRYVAFRSLATNLVTGDANGVSDVFRRDLQLAVTIRISVDGSGAEANAASSAPSLSADGQTVAFESNASNLVTGDTNAKKDVFLREVLLGATTRVSTSTYGVQADEECVDASLSGDGSHLAFQSDATNLVHNDTNLTADIFLHARTVVPFVLASTGTCPGALTISVTGALPGRFVGILHGAPGSFVLNTGPCTGLSLDLATPTLAVVIRANSGGAVSRNFTGSSGACGRSVQAVDGGSCRKSNVIVL